MKNHSKFKFLLVAITLAISLSTSNAQQIVAFKNVNLITMTSEKVLPSQTVITKGDRIVQIGAATDVKNPDGAKIIDGTGNISPFDLMNNYILKAIS